MAMFCTTRHTRRHKRFRKVNRHSLPGYSCASSCSWTYLIKVVTARGNVFTGTYPQNSLVLNAVSAGAIGDLYLVFDTYTYYAIVSHSSQSNCPSSSSNASYTGYCLETASGDTGPGFDVPASVSGNIGFSVSMQNLNAQGADIILDQFSLMYQNSFYGNSHQNFVPWYITATGTPNNGFIPILKQYQPQILKYNAQKTVYYLSGSCVTASTGPTTENGNCATAGSFNSPLGSGQVATVFLLSNGWELNPNSYTLTQGGSTSLVYSGTGIDVNYGQNSPYVTTLYE